VPRALAAMGHRSSVGDRHPARYGRSPQRVAGAACAKCMAKLGAAALAPALRDADEWADEWADFELGLRCARFLGC